MNRLFFLIAFLGTTCAYSQTPLTLLQAKEQSKISVTASWNATNAVYGNYLLMNVKNLLSKPIKVIIPVGETTFLCGDPGQQNQMVVKADTLYLKPSSADTISLYTVCISPSKGCPHTGVNFTLVKQDDPKLQRISQVISENMYYNSSTAQAAVWSVQGHRPISTVFSRDSIIAWRMARAVSDITGQAMPSHIDLRDHHIVVLGGEVSYQVAKPVFASLAVYDSAGNVANLLMEKKFLPAGLHQFKFHVNEIADIGTKYWVKLIDDKSNVLYSKEISEGRSENSTESFSQLIIFPFTLDKGYKDCNLGVYDIQGKLVTEMIGNRYWEMGTHNVNYVLHHNRKNDSVFYVKLMTKDKKVIAQKAIQKKAPNADKYAEEEMAIQLKYPIAYKTEKAKCVIFSEYGDEVALVFEDKKLNAGPNEIKYKLKHTYGKKAKFILQVLGPTGQILFCKEIVGK